MTPLGARRRWLRGLRELLARDPDLARLVESVGRPEFALRGGGFPTLLRAIVAQQVSAASARAIWGRTLSRFDPPEPAAVLAAGGEALRELGFSRPKAAYATGLARALVAGDLDLDRVAAMPDEAAVAVLTEMPGIGRWTAEVYLLFGLGRPDIWPAADLAVQTAIGRLRGRERRPDAAEARELAEAWRPWRSVGAICMWHAYRTMPP